MTTSMPHPRWTPLAALLVGLLAACASPPLDVRLKTTSNTNETRSLATNEPPSPKPLDVYVYELAADDETAFLKKSRDALVPKPDEPPFGLACWELTLTRLSTEIDVRDELGKSDQRLADDTAFVGVFAQFNEYHAGMKDRAVVAIDELDKVAFLIGKDSVTIVPREQD
ncbi:MAG: hypothetical protein IPM29_16370 [Planctomycetes bacterium]|nr:hypothetical protein [Planctomycetota bacterium]